MSYRSTRLSLELGSYVDELFDICAQFYKTLQVWPKVENIFSNTFKDYAHRVVLQADQSSGSTINKLESPHFEPIKAVSFAHLYACQSYHDFQRQILPNYLNSSLSPSILSTCFDYFRLKTVIVQNC